MAVVVVAVAVVAAVEHWHIWERFQSQFQPGPCLVGVWQAGRKYSWPPVWVNPCSSLQSYWTWWVDTFGNTCP